MKEKNDLIKDITKHLDRSIETLDPETLSQIRIARYNALEKKRPGFIRWALPVSGIAVTAVVLFVSYNLLTAPGNIPPQPVNVVETTTDKPEPGNEKTQPAKDMEREIQPDQIELVEILSSDQNLDLFENLEFYAWLAEDDNFTG